MIVVDSDVIIWLLRGDIKIVNSFKETVIDTNGQVYVTPVQIAEIYTGARMDEIMKIDKFFSSLNIINIDSNIGKLAGEFMKKFRKSHGITLADALIGASTKIHEFKLWTLNIRHYPMLKVNEFWG